MIRMIKSSSAGHAKSYFQDGLNQSDYYLGPQELKGWFHGKLADRLGISGEVSKPIFDRLCDNRHPFENRRLTPRTNSSRIVGYDLNFHCPKSVSILHALSADDHVLKAFRESVQDTMKDMEQDACTRNRKTSLDEDRKTGELAWGEFIHQTARPVEDHTPDPHLHAHCYVFNATWDDVEKRVKAAKFKEVKRDLPYHQDRFQKRLADRLAAAGYKIKRQGKSFEIDGVPKEAIALFSKRTDQIGRVAREKGITDEKELSELGAKTRASKRKGMTMEDLKEDWRSQIRSHVTSSDSDTSKPLRGKRMTVERDLSATREAVDYAIEHSFERTSVITERRLVMAAYRRSCGNPAISLKDIDECLRLDPRILRVKEKGQRLCTTMEVLAEERRMVELAKKGKGSMSPLYNNKPDIKGLKPQQESAVRHILTTSDQVSIVRGAAGTGKTRLMTEAVRLIEETGKTVTVVAPTAQASRGVLREEGFKDAETVASFLQNKMGHEKLKGQVLWVDEAGLLGTKETADILELASRQKMRVIFGGDTRQHSSVVRGDALRILNTVASIETAEITEILRQKHRPYREAVQDLSNGDILQAFEKLEGMGAIKLSNTADTNDALLDDYMKAVKAKHTTLIVSPTHAQGEAVTERVRERLRSANRLGKKDVNVRRLVNTSMTEAERSDAANYAPGQIIQFNQNVKGIRRGSVWRIANISGQSLKMQSSLGETKTMTLKEATKFEVFDEKTIGLAKGDQIRITKNSFDKAGKRLDNGTTLTVAGIDKKGKVKLKNNISRSIYEVESDFGHIAHAYCVTSHASQGKTVDEVFISQPSSTFAATDLKQFYVSVSRGRLAAHIYTDERDELLEHAGEIGNRRSATELIGGHNKHTEVVANQLRVRRVPESQSKTAKTIVQRPPSRESIYESGPEI